MTKQKVEYKLVVERIKKALAQSPEALEHWVNWSERYLVAASEMTKDEFALIEAYLRRDLQSFAEGYLTNDKPSLFSEAIKNTLWDRLADITDKTQLEWQEIMQDLAHHGVYQAGEIVGLGVLVCEKCGHETQHTHVGVLTPCISCGYKAFHRIPFPA